MQPRADWLYFKQAARYLAISKSTLARLVKAGQIPAYRVGKRWLRFKKADLDAWLEGQRTTPCENTVLSSKLPGT